MGWTTGPYTTEPGPRRTFGKLTMWSEDGFLYCLWSDGQKDVLDLPSAKSRFAAIAEEMNLWESKKDNGGPGVDRAFAAQMYHELRGSLQNLRDCIKDAEFQGDSTNPKVRYEKMKAFLRSKRVNLIGDTSRIAGPSAVAEQLVYPVAYGNPKRLPDYVPAPKTDTLYFDNPPLPPK